MPVYAIEIILTRTLGGVELKAARQLSGLPMAPSGDGKSLAVLVSARNEDRAIKKVWRRLEDALPIDVICTLFPGPDGTLRMSIPFAPGVKKRIRAWAKVTGKSTEEFLSEAVAEALARDRSSDSIRQECVLNMLLHSCATVDAPLSTDGPITISALPSWLRALVRRASNSGNRVTFVDDKAPIAVLIRERELEELEDALAVAECRLRKTDDAARILHDEAVEEESPGEESDAGGKHRGVV